MRYIRRTTIFVILFLLTVISAIAQSTAASNKTIALFDLTPTTQKMQAISVSDSVIIQKQSIELNEAIYQENAISEGDQIVLPLFSGESIEVEITRVSTNVMGTTSITGKISGEIPGNIIITYKDRRLFGTLHLYDQHRHFNIKSDPKTAEHYLVEKDIEAMEPFECGGAITITEDRKSNIMNKYKKERQNEQ